jgi:hypothetical protein
MDAPDSFADVIALWPSAADLSRDMHGVKEVTVRAWKKRGIPAEYWPEIVALAQGRGFAAVTLELLASLAACHAGRPASMTSPREAA